jgi:hypothetical protein
VRARGSIIAFAVLGPPIAWGVQLVGGYTLEEAACSTASGDTPVLSDPTTIIWAISTGALVVAGLAGIAGFVSWLGARGAGGSEPSGRNAFLAAAGALAALVFLEAIILSTVALMALDTCGPA